MREGTALHTAGFEIVTNQYRNWTWQFATRGGSPWHDVRMRRAANLAVDRRAMKDMLGGLMAEGAGLLPTGDKWNPGTSFKWAYIPTEAGKLPAEAGISSRNSLETKVGISASGSGQMQPMAMNEALQQVLKEVGIEVEFEVFELNALLTIWRDGFQAPNNRGIHAVNISLMAIDPFTAPIRFLRSDLVPPAEVNWGYLNRPDYDALIEKVLNEFDPAKRIRLVVELHAKVVDDALHLFVAHDLNPRGMTKKLKGFVQARPWFQDQTPVRLK